MCDICEEERASEEIQATLAEEWFEFLGMSWEEFWNYPNYRDYRNRKTDGRKSQ